MSVWAAARKGDLDGVKAAVENGADIEERGGVLGGTGLHDACYNGHTAVVDFLIQRGARVNSRNKYGYLPIHSACREGHLDTVKLLVSKGSDFRSTSNDGLTPFHLASLNGHTSVADYLMQRVAEAADSGVDIQSDTAKSSVSLTRKATTSADVLVEENPRFLEAAASDALKYGMKRNNRISVFFIGQDRVGKTSLKKRILGETFDSQEPSTVGIEVDIVEVDEKDKAKPWQRTRDQQRMASQEQVNGAIGEYAAKRLKDSEKSDLTEVKQQHKPKPRHRTVDHQRMAPGENVNNIMAEDSSQTMKHSERFGTTEVKQQGKVKHHKNDKGNKKSHVILTPELKKIIKENMVKVDKYEDDMTKVRLLLQDVAGQSPLYDIHSILLRLQSLFVLVVGLDKDLADEAKPLFVDERKNIKIEIENYLLETNLDYANRWMSALHHISLDRELTEETNFVPPATILVLTKPDMVTGTLEQIQQKIQKATDTLLDSFTDYKCRPHIVGTFVIDNTKSEHSELQNLREKIFETSQEILKAQDKFPINWLRLERGLVTVMESERYITWQDVEELGRESGVNENLAAAVESLHQQNVVVHFRDDEKARNLVVLDPQWLVKLFTSIITIPPTHKQSPKRAELWKCLTDRGELLSDFLDIVLVDHTKHLQALTRMMERVSLICRWNEELVGPVNGEIQESKTRCARAA